MNGLSWNNLRYDWTQIRGFDNGLFTTWYKNSIIRLRRWDRAQRVIGYSCRLCTSETSLSIPSDILIVTILMMVIPNTVLVIPLFLEVDKINQIGQLWPLAVIFGFFPFGAYLSFIHFDTALPRELIEAARVDGLGEFGIFARVALPVSMQAVAIVAFFSFLASWTNYFLPLVLLPVDNQQTLTVGLQQLITGSQLYDPSGGSGFASSAVYATTRVCGRVADCTPVGHFSCRSTVPGSWHHGRCDQTVKWLKLSKRADDCSPTWTIALLHTAVRVKLLCVLNLGTRSEN